MKEFDIKQVMSVKVSAIGIIVTILEKGDWHAFKEAEEIAYPFHAFDILHHFLNAKLRMLKGDFGEFKEYETTRLSKMNAIILGDILCRLRSDYHNDDDANVITDITEFLKKVGLYQPKHFPAGIQEWANHAHVVPFNFGRDVKEMRSLVEAIQEKYTAQSELMENLHIYGRFIDPKYNLVIPQRGHIATGGYWVEPPHNPHIVPNSPYIPFNFPSVRLHYMADVINGIAQMETLPDGGFEIRMVNGLGNISLATLEKEDLHALVKALAR